MKIRLITVAIALAVAVPSPAAAAAPPTVSPGLGSGTATVPASAMLQASDLGGVTPTPVTDDYWDSLRPPQPCSATPYPSTVLVRAGRAVSVLIGVDDRPTVVVEHVASYRVDGAHRYLRELRRAVAACRADAGWTVLATGVAGNESVLLRHREFIDFAGAYKNTYVLTARVGSALVVLADAGWETGNGHEALVRQLSAAAVRRAAVAG
jgi:hypothetical protein